LERTAEEDSTPELRRFRADLRRHRQAVRRSFEQFFFEARSQIRRDADEEAVALLQNLQPGEAAERELAEMGFADPEAAVENLLRFRDGPRRADLAVVRKGRASLEQGLAALLASAAGDYETELDTLRRFHNEELLRIGVNDIHGLLDASEVEEDLSSLAEVCLGGALDIARQAL